MDHFEAAQKLLASSGHTVESLLKSSDSRDFEPVPLNFKLSGRINAKIREIQSRNVLGIIPGSETQASTEAVLFGAHWDHLGIALPINGDNIYNGAIDNGTGVGLVLDIARVWGQLRQKPRRSALFAFWTAEESGLRGAEYFSRHPVIPANKIAVNINYDAVFPSARTKDVVVTGAERTSIWPTVQEAARRFSLEIVSDPRPEQGSYYRSDHFMLARIGIPAFSVKTGSKIIARAEDFAAAQFREYNTRLTTNHRTEYDPNWDFASLEHAGRFGFLTGLNIAELDDTSSLECRRRIRC
ncbi:MAG: M28 family peptidase [Bryobacteraceae bacterium]